MPQPKNILIYRLGSLGDTVVALPCFHLIRKTFSQARIVLLTNEPVSGKAAPAMDILENSGLCDGVIHYPVGTRSLGKLATVGRQIHELRPGLIVNLAAGRGWLKSLRDEGFLRACGVKKIIGTPFHRQYLQVQPTDDGKFERESQRLAARLTSLGVVDLADPKNWRLELTLKEKNQTLNYLPAKQEPFLAVSIGTKLVAKDWGEENWKYLLTSVSREIPKSTLVLLGAADEWDRSERLRQLWRGSSVNLCGKTSPRLSAAILERGRLFIGHDSGPLHLASAVGIPSVGVFSWHNPPGQWFPGHPSWKFIKILYPELPVGGWHEGLRMKRGLQEGILLVKPEAVFQSAMELWSEYSRVYTENGK